VYAMTPEADGSMTYALPFPCDDGTVTANVSDTEMVFSCEWTIDSTKIKRLATINRVSGEYQSVFTIAATNKSLVHVEKCSAGTKQF
jgi:hypothetical protein